MWRVPLSVPLSRLMGAMPTRAAISLRFADPLSVTDNELMHLRIDRVTADFACVNRVADGLGVVQAVESRRARAKRIRPMVTHTAAAGKMAVRLMAVMTLPIAGPTNDPKLSGR